MGAPESLSVLVPPLHQATRTLYVLTASNEALNALGEEAVRTGRACTSTAWSPSVLIRLTLVPQHRGLSPQGLLPLGPSSL